MYKFSINDEYNKLLAQKNPTQKEKEFFAHLNKFM